MRGVEEEGSAESVSGWVMVGGLRMGLWDFGWVVTFGGQVAEYSAAEEDDRGSEVFVAIEHFLPLFC